MPEITKKKKFDDISKTQKESEILLGEENEFKEEALESSKLNRQQRKEIVSYVKKLINFYCWSVFGVMMLSIAKNISWIGRFTDDKGIFSEKVLIVLLGTTTVNVIGLAIVLTRGIYRES